jgi:hypothetical protein
MLALGRQATAEAGLAGRVAFHELRLPAEKPPHARYALLFSNSLLHHLADPSVLWSSLGHWGDGAHVFVMDLLRPPSRSRARALVDQYAAREPEVLRHDFFHSLLAAYRPDELRGQLERAGLAALQLEVVSDRHFIVWGRLADDGAAMR